MKTQCIAVVTTALVMSTLGSFGQGDGQRPHLRLAQTATRVGGYGSGGGGAGGGGGGGGAGFGIPGSPPMRFPNQSGGGGNAFGGGGGDAYLSGGGPGGVVTLLGRPEVQSDLGLDAAQKQRVTRTVQAFRAREARILEAGSPPLTGPEPPLIFAQRAAQTMAQARAETERTAQSLIALLTPPQQGRLEQLRLQTLGAWALEEPRVASALGLSPAQKDQLHQLQQEVQRKAREILVGIRSLPPESRVQAHATLGPRFREIQSQADAAKLQTVLTPDQQQRLRNLCGRPAPFPLDSGGSYVAAGGGGSGGPQ